MLDSRILPKQPSSGHSLTDKCFSPEDRPQALIDRRLTTQMAAQCFGISDRQCLRLLSRYREHGPLGMASRRRGKPSNNQQPSGLAQYALNIIRGRYTDFEPTLACEKLPKWHDVYLSKGTVQSLMVKPDSEYLVNNGHQKFSSHAIAGPFVVN